MDAVCTYSANFMYLGSFSPYNNTLLKPYYK